MAKKKNKVDYFSEDIEKLDKISAVLDSIDGVPDREPDDEDSISFGAPEDEPSREEVAEKVVHEAGTMKIRVSVPVNGHHAGDELVVDAGHPFYGGLVAQKLAEVIG